MEHQLRAQRVGGGRWRLSAYLVAEQDVDASGTLSVHLVDGSQRKVAHARHLADQFCGGELLEVKSVIHCDGLGGKESSHNGSLDFTFSSTSDFLFQLPCKLDATLCSPFLLLPCLSSRGLS